MTLEEIRRSDKTFLTPGDIAPVLGSDSQTIRVTARVAPERVGYPHEDPQGGLPGVPGSKGGRNMKNYEYWDYGGMGGAEHPMHREFERGERLWKACTWALTALLAALLCAAQVH